MPHDARQHKRRTKGFIKLKIFDCLPAVSAPTFDNTFWNVRIKMIPGTKVRTADHV